MGTSSITSLTTEYKSKYNTYKELDRIVFDKLSNMVSENHFFIMDLTHRLKSFDSLKEKLIKKNGKYENIYDLTDLCGFRIVCYFSDTVDEIASAISKIFDVDYANSIDKRNSLEDTQFGYLSLHYICSLKGYEGYSTELTSIRFEIQIRTVLQHAWAEIEHDLGYKSEFGVPGKIRREFSRIASLLEVADEQFVGLRKSTKDYTQDVREKISAGVIDDIPLDQLTLSEYMEHNISFNRVVADFSAQLNISVINSDTSRYVVQLHYLEIRTLGDLIKVFRANKQMLIDFIAEKVNLYELETVTTSMILRYLCRAELIRSNYSEEKILSFMKLTYSEKKAQKNAQKVIEASKMFKSTVHQ